MATVSIQEVTKRYGPVPATNRVSLSVQEGELVTLLGPSGCGKTTLLRLIAGFLRPDEGEIWLGDRRLSSAEGVVPPEHRNLSMIFQSYAVWPHMTVFNNVAYGLKMRRVPRGEIRSRVKAALRMVRMEHLGDRYPSQLSGGQQQRVALARALVVEPDVLLLDEPLSNLDANLRAEMRYEIRRLHEQFGYAAVYVTHDQAEAMVISDRVVLMNQGQIEQAGTPAEVYQQPTSMFVASFLGQANCLPGRLMEIGQEYATVQWEQLLFRVAAPNPGSFTAASPIAMCVRPHDLQLYEQPPDCGAANLFAARVVEHSFLGPMRNYTLLLTGSSLSIRAEVPPERHFPVGATLTVGIEPRAIVLVPAPDDGAWVNANEVTARGCVVAADTGH